MGALLFALCRPCVSLAGQAQPLTAAHRYVRNYTATAYINLLSITIFSRGEVGFGTASAQEEVSPTETNISLRFLSGSFPGRARGLNRFGFIQENIRERDHKCVQADYFGLITASGEESLAQAKAALNTKSQEKTSFVAAQASIDATNATYAIRHLLLPASYRGENADRLLGEVTHRSFSPKRANLKGMRFCMANSWAPFFTQYVRP